MKVRNALLAITGLEFMLLFCIACELGPIDYESDRTLYIKFSNEPSSAFTITDIQLLKMGEVDQPASTSSEVWSENILTGGKSVAPGEHQFFTLEIPNGHYCQYRLGVYDENNNRVILHEQPGYPDDAMQGTITHWGSDRRAVSVTVTRDTHSNLIISAGYSDWAGID